jgi:hypothetical protein
MGLWALARRRVAPRRASLPRLFLGRVECHRGHWTRVSSGQQGGSDGIFNRVRMPDGCVGACFLVDITCSVRHQPDNIMKTYLAHCQRVRLRRWSIETSPTIHRSVRQETSRPAEVSRWVRCRSSPMEKRIRGLGAFMLLCFLGLFVQINNI